MENKKNDAISNTGPIIHLNEINLINCLDIFSSVKIPPEVANELKKNKVLIPKKISIILLDSSSKDFLNMLIQKYSLDFGEAEAIALNLQEKSEYFLTDDLDARRIANEFQIEVHGTIGIILKAFKEKIISKKTAIEKIKEIKQKSSLFITHDLINEVILEIEKY